MIYNTVSIPYHCTNDVLLKFLDILCNLIKKYDFFVFLRNEGIFVATFDIKEPGVEVSDSNVILMLSMATWVWMSPLTTLRKK